MQAILLKYYLEETTRIITQHLPDRLQLFSITEIFLIESFWSGVIEKQNAEVLYGKETVQQVSATG